MLDDTGSAAVRVLLAAASQLSYYIPLFIVYIVGVSVAVRYRPRHPAVSRRLILAVVIDLVAIVPGSLLGAWLMVNRMPLGLEGSFLTLLYSGIGAVRAIIHAAATAVLISAVFVDRGSPPDEAAVISPGAR